MQSTLKYFIKNEVNGQKLVLHRDMLLKRAAAKSFALEDLNQLHLRLRWKKNLEAWFWKSPSLVRILLILSASICTVERSFSGFRRFKGYPWSKMNQERLNAVKMMNVQTETAKDLKLDSLINEFILRAPVRKITFS